MDRELLHERARIVQQTRLFFDQRGYLETDTPVLSPDLIPESCLEVFETAYIRPGTKQIQACPYWLVPSPEIWMKRLIAQHGESLYQICKCFRNGESVGRQHSPEFTMLEYYTMHADYKDSLTITEALFSHLLQGVSGGAVLQPPFRRITIEEAFERWAGFKLFEAVETRSLEAQACKLGLQPPPGLDTAALYDLIFIHAVEPALCEQCSEGPIALIDYPAFVPCLAKLNSDGKTRQRWELYAAVGESGKKRGLELANCFSEETDPEEIRRFFAAETAAKNAAALVRHATDPAYLLNGLPPCSGVALGMDRLIMALTGRSTIDSVLPFPMSTGKAG
jgi:lysyl-tRNA synthetase class 2